MAYIGRQNLGGAYRQLDDISSGFDGSDTTHTMQVNSQNVTVGDVNQIILSLGGVIQKPGTDFTVSGSVLTFTTAPAANTSFFAVLLGSDNGGTVTPTDLSVSTGKIAADAVTSAKIADDAVTGDHVASSGAFAIGASGTASSIAGITFYQGQSGSIYTTDVSGTDNDAENNTAYGAAALDAITTGDSNTAIGEQSLSALTTGTQNTAVGYGSGKLIEGGSYNTCFGHNAGSGITSGIYNTALGFNVLAAADAENYNLGVGEGVMEGSINGAEYNVGIGNNVLDALTTGDNNTAVGFASMSGATTGVSNTAVGYQALGTGTLTGSYNTAVGVQAMNNSTSAENNVAIGYSAGNDAMLSLTTGSNNIVIGNNSHTSFEAKIDITVGSDRRDKTDIEDLPEAAGLSFVKQLRPVTYVWDNRSNYYPHTHPKYGERDHSKKESRVHPGFISQEVKELERSIGWDDDHIVNTTNDNSWKLKYSALIPLLTKAIQELSAKVEELEGKI